MTATFALKLITSGESSSTWSTEQEMTMSITNSRSCWPGLWKQQMFCSDNRVTLTRTTALATWGPICIILLEHSSWPNVSVLKMKFGVNPFPTRDESVLQFCYALCHTNGNNSYTICYNHFQEFVLFFHLAQFLLFFPLLYQQWFLICRLMDLPKI